MQNNIPEYYWNTSPPKLTQPLRRPLSVPSGTDSGSGILFWINLCVQSQKVRYCTIMTHCTIKVVDLWTLLEQNVVCGQSPKGHRFENIPVPSDFLYLFMQNRTHKFVSFFCGRMCFCRFLSSCTECFVKWESYSPIGPTTWPASFWLSPCRNLMNSLAINEKVHFFEWTTKCTVPFWLHPIAMLRKRERARLCRI